MLGSLLLSILAGAPALPVTRAASDDPAPAAGRRDFPELSLTLDLRGLAALEPVEAKYGDLVAAWEGRLGESEVRVQLVARERDEFLAEPEDVTDMLAPTTVEDLLRAQARAGRKRQAKPRPGYLVAGSYGWVPYGSIKSTRVRVTADRVFDSHVLGGILEDRYYSVEVECRPPLDEGGDAIVLDFLENGVRYEGPTRNHEWTDEEVRRRWIRDAVADLHDDFEPPIRTEHYLILGNSSGGNLFAKKMEAFHDEVQRVFPFDEVPRRRLLPVFVFRTPEQYHAFLEKNTGMSLEDAAKTAGVAFGDCYATVYRSPNDPVHIHEATHQLFRNRLRLGGGGSWFQEGVAEYMSSRSSERRSYAKPRAKRGSQVPFHRFFTGSAMIEGEGQDESKGSAARANYLQAASIIHFARESRFAKDKFNAFLYAMGNAPAGNLARIEEALLQVYEVDVDGFEAEWVDYWR
jgi:hypothetical protein